MFLDTTATERELKGIVDKFLLRLGIKTSLVLVKITDDSYIHVAGARGLVLKDFPILGNTAIGEIFFNTKWLDRLTQSELEYVISHEVAHIYFNHIFTTATVQFIKTKINELAKDSDIVKLVWILKQSLDLWIFLMQRQIPFEVTLHKEQEIAADALAIHLTHNKAAATSFFKRYVNNDLTKPSHIWETLGIQLPVMTLQERINEINNAKDITAQINSFRIDHNIVISGCKGMVIHMDFNVQGLKSQCGKIEAYFNYLNGAPICDCDSQYRAEDGQVAVTMNFSPPFDNTKCSDFTLFMPYDQLHMGVGNFDLMCQVTIWDISVFPEKIVNSEWIGFAYSTLFLGEAFPIL